MSTPIIQNINRQTASQQPLPPVERPERYSCIAAPLLASSALWPADESLQSRANASTLGRWVYDHHTQFSKNSPLAWYGIRNVLNNMVAILGLMVTIVPLRMGMGKIALLADGHGMKKTQGFFSNTILQNSLGVGVSFATFRTLYKMGQRAYDRVFINPANSEETSQAIRDLPGNWLADFKQIAPAEYPATMTASFALVGIRSAFTPRMPELAANHWKDIAACALVAYPAFFELTEHLGRNLQLSRGYTTVDKNEHINKDKQTLTDFLTRQIPAVACGIVPYIGFNNLWYRKTGRQLSFNTAQVEKGLKTIDGFKTALWKERPYEAFWMFSLGRDLYYDAYDKVTGHAHQKREGKYQPAASQLLATFTSEPAVTDGHRPSTDISDIIRDGVTVARTDKRHSAA